MNTAISDSAVKLNNKIDGVVAQVANLTTDFIENFKLIKSEVNHAKLAVTQLNNTVTQLQTKTDTQTEQIQKILDDKINSTDKNNNNSSELINRMTNIVIFGIPEADGNISDKQRLDMNRGQNDNNNSGNNCRDNFIDNEFGTELWREEAVALNEQHEDIEESLSSVTRNKIRD
ncbi:hypothetical protein HCN44_010318 [Aphidius gifuensis]|uniref:Uncharacterized protein n=1 Tax=Aphidius gifuensis TaxID=684658 RepID=A0A835CTW5_APHGI|nr:hypothetical protein HCN44_010318 [Aphidius gifuensis]